MPTISSQDAAAWVHDHLVGWPALIQSLAVELLRRYGTPQERGTRHLAWYDNAPWKRTVLWKEGAPHNFPRPHQDILEQTIDYRVPLEKVPELLSYNGSLLVDHTRGELTVHCDSERANLLTLNIADDIVKGERTADQGSAYHAQVVRGLEIGESEAYPQRLKFAPATAAQTADPGAEAPLLRHLGD